MEEKMRKLAQYKELHPEMRDYIIKRLMIGAAVLFLGIVISFAMWNVLPFLLGLAVGGIIAAYFLFVLITLLLGQGEIYEGIVVKTSGDIKGGKLKATADLVTGKPMRPEILIRTIADNKYLQIPMHNKNTFAVGNKVCVFTPSNAIIQRSEDSFYCSSYYKIKLETMYTEPVKENE